MSTRSHNVCLASAVVAWLLLCASFVCASDFTLLGEARTCEQRCDAKARRCKADCGPTPTPAPTAVPIPCEPVGGRKDYVDGQERMLCFDAGDKRAFMEVSVVSQPSCGGELAVQLQAPSGARFNVIASQPNTILSWEPGRWYLWTKQIWGNCSPFTFTPR